MPASLGQTLADRRKQLGLSLREVERQTGIHNAHLSQIENGGIERPDPAILWTLAQLYDLPYATLLHAAGHAGPAGPRAGRNSLSGAALKALGELTPEEQRQVLDFMDKLRKHRRQAGADP